MAEISAFTGIRYNPEHVRLGGVLAPPYDVITDSQRDQLYARDLRNIVRIDYGASYPEDVPGTRDRYTRAAEFLRSWLDLQILVQDAEPSLYLAYHEFTLPSGATAHRRGILATVAARPWPDAPLRPHERTLSAPKEDRLALMRATGVQTSPVFAIWDSAPGIDELLTHHAAEPPILGGRTDGELGSEKHLLWRIAHPADIAALREALAGARLYVADGHHRYETAVAYADRCLVYLSAAGDSGLTILPTHRLLRHPAGGAFSVDDLWARLDDAWDLQPAPDVHAALASAAEMRASHHAIAMVGRDTTGVLSRLRRPGTGPREGLDATVLEAEVLAPAGVTPEAVAEGALRYTRDPGMLARAVASGAADIGFGLQPVSPEDVIAVAEAGETMPQKSTYFYPKVPTGLVLHRAGEPAG